jgi:hypothetical protein
MRRKQAMRTKFDLSKLLESSHLPLNKSVVVRIGIRSDKLPSPIYAETQLRKVALGERREVFQPVLSLLGWIRRDIWRR